MVVTNNTKRFLDLKTKAIDKLLKVSGPKFKLLKTNKIYFDKPIGNITALTNETGEDNWNVLIRLDGTRVFPRAVDGSDLLKIIKNLETNQFFSYLEINGTKSRIRPKRKNGT